MNELSNYENSLENLNNNIIGLTSNLLSTIPMALASPILSHQRTGKQAHLAEVYIEAKHLEKIEILKTIQILGQCGQLTPELSTQLLLVYQT